MFALICYAIWFASISVILVAEEFQAIKAHLFTAAPPASRHEVRCAFDKTTVHPPLPYVRPQFRVYHILSVLAASGLVGPCALFYTKTVDTWMLRISETAHIARLRNFVSAVFRTVCTFQKLHLVYLYFTRYKKDAGTYRIQHLLIMSAMPFLILRVVAVAQHLVCADEDKMSHGEPPLVLFVFMHSMLACIPLVESFDYKHAAEILIVAGVAVAATFALFATHEKDAVCSSYNRWHLCCHVTNLFFIAVFTYRCVAGIGVELRRHVYAPPESTSIIAASSPSPRTIPASSPTELSFAHQTTVWPITPPTVPTRTVVEALTAFLGGHCCGGGGAGRDFARIIGSYYSGQEAWSVIYDRLDKESTQWYFKRFAANGGWKVHYYELWGPDGPARIQIPLVHVTNPTWFWEEGSDFPYRPHFLLPLREWSGSAATANQKTQLATNDADGNPGSSNTAHAPVAELLRLIEGNIRFLSSAFPGVFTFGGPDYQETLHWPRVWIAPNIVSRANLCAGCTADPLDKLWRGSDCIDDDHKRSEEPFDANRSVLQTMRVYHVYSPLFCGYRLVPEAPLFQTADGNDCSDDDENDEVTCKDSGATSSSSQHTKDAMRRTQARIGRFTDSTILDF